MKHVWDTETVGEFQANKPSDDDDDDEAEEEETSVVILCKKQKKPKCIIKNCAFLI